MKCSVFEWTEFVKHKTFFFKNYKKFYDNELVFLDIPYGNI